MTASLINDCFLHDKDRLRHDEALTLLRERLAPIVGTETVGCGQALNRILAEPAVAPHAIPLHTNSAVDGYAFRHADSTASPMLVSSRIVAGDLAPAPLQSGTAVRIFTGAAMPQGADTVAMQEDCLATEGKVTLPQGLKPGANCRKAGEDLQPGQTFLVTGTRLAAADLAALASAGVSKIEVYKQLRIALFSNGNEMRVPGTMDRQLLPGEVYDANQPLITALSAQLPVKINQCGILRDDADAARTALSSVSNEHDVIITTGGASRGSEDHMLSTLEKLGKRHLWQLAVKPGRPMMFGQITSEDVANDCLFFGLPGNPVAAMVCFLLYVRPALLRLAGANWHNPVRYRLPALFSISNKKPDRREFLRGILVQGDDGIAQIDKFARDGSGLISSLREADGLIEIPEEVTNLEKGDLVSFIPFAGLL